MYGEVVMEIPHHDFESAMEELKQEVGAKQDSDLTGKQLRALCGNFKEIYKKVCDSCEYCMRISFIIMEHTNRLPIPRIMFTSMLIMITLSHFNFFH